jgi:diguanylate cyclase (GGDEF)-like protein
MTSRVIGGVLKKLRPDGGFASWWKSAPSDPDAPPVIPVVRRANLESHLEKLAAQASDEASGITVFFLGIDGLRFINRHYGHAAGDQMLRRAGWCLQSLKHPFEGIAHIGGDEFAAFLRGPADPSTIRAIAQDALDAISQPRTLAGRTVGITCSIGICSFPQHGPARKLLSHAQVAMAAAKASGPGTYCFYAGQPESQSAETLHIERQLRSALANREFFLVFQPKVSIATGKVTAAETLIRWKHPQLGLIPPDVFIPMAERLGLINAIGEWVIDEACRHARIWRSKGLRMRVAVNISSRQLVQPNLLAQIAAILKRHDIHPSLLTCEITESLAIEDMNSSGAAMQALRRAGIHLSIDDFGTGYSNLSHLRRLPVQELKIDRSFVTEIDTSAEANSLVEAIIRMAHALGKRVVAEGVETAGQLEALHSLGCDEAQGYFLSGPISSEMLLLWATTDSDERREFAPSLFHDTQYGEALGDPQPGPARR